MRMGSFINGNFKIILHYKLFIPSYRFSSHFSSFYTTVTHTTNPHQEMSCFGIFNTNSQSSSSTTRSISEMYKEKEHNVIKFSWSDLTKATNNFNEPLIVAIKKLNSQGSSQVLHGDFKSSNVLLDEDFKPKLSDFGLAREESVKIGDSSLHQICRGRTPGYAAPEYILTGHINDKSDIWSFGVVLYEVLTGRRALDRKRPKSEKMLLEWVKHYPADSERFSKLMDPRLNNSYSLIAARRIAKLADSCLNKNPKDRPTMSHVVTSLKQALQESEDQRI